MQQLKRIRACFITFIMILSSLSILFINTDSVHAEDFLEGDMDEWAEMIDLLEYFFGDVLSPHPYRFIGAYSVTNESVNISGDIVFDLYFSSTLLTQIAQKYKDKVNVSLHYIGAGNETTQKVKNANKTITLNPEFLGDPVQEFKKAIEFEDVNLTLFEGDYLIFSVELIQSDKPISQIVENRFDRGFKKRIENIARLLNESQDENLKDIGEVVKEVITLLDDYGIESDDIADLANSLRSSSFYYGSNSYSSSVYIPFESKDNKTLYFQNTPNLDLDLFGLGNIKIVNESKPTVSTDYAWPPSITDIGNFESEEDMASYDWMSWFMIWLLYSIDAPPEVDEDLLTYYLSRDGNLVFNEPEGDDTFRANLKDTKTWDNITLDRNKIIKNASAELYLHFPKILYLRKVSINVTLFYEDGNETVNIASAEKNLDRVSLVELIQRGPNSATEFVFEDAEDKEIWYGKNIGIKIKSSQGPLFSLRNPKVLCDSATYPSSISLLLKETDNVNITDDLEDKKIIPGNSAKFVLNISSKYEDTLNINVDPINSNNIDNWNIELKNTIDISEDETKSIEIFINSTVDEKGAYGDWIDFVVNVTGNTGFDSTEASVDVDQDAVDYDFTIIKPSSKEIKHGESKTYTFIITNNNTGYWPDRYIISAESEHNWTVEVDYDKNKNIETNEELIVNVTVFVPEDTEIKSDIISLNVTSESSLDYKGKSLILTIKTSIITPNILEQIYNFFEAISEDIGLDEMLGDYAAAFLIFLLVFLVIIFLIPSIYIIKKSYVELICTDLIKEIEPEEEATYEISIKNPTNKVLTYEITTEAKESESWDTILDKARVIVDSKQTKNIILKVKPNDNIKSDDWIEVLVKVKVVEKQNKSEQISTLTTIANGKAQLNIIGVYHWPRIFKKGDRVETSFRLRNTGNVSTGKVSVFLYINGKEKNKVEDIIIPRGGYAEIEIPWIAVKGKNKIDIEVK